MEPTQIGATVDYEKPGKQLGHLAVPYSHNLCGWANLQVPVAVLAAGEGPTVLLMAGNHGDEYPGQIAILKLCRELPLEVVRGRLIMIPALSVPASKAAARLSPLDGRNFNRCFPGDPTGSVSEMLAHYLTTHLFPRADVVIDLHTGGRSFDFYPCAHMHLVPDRDQRRKMVAAAEAYNTDFALLYTDIAGTGLLPVEAERQGKVVVTTEIGGGEPVPAKVHRLSQEGLRNVLVHLGVVAGEKRSRAELGLPPTRWVQSLDRQDYRFAPESGIYESVVDLGSSVAAGDKVGQVQFLERPDREPAAVVAPGCPAAAGPHRQRTGGYRRGRLVAGSGAGHRRRALQPQRRQRPAGTSRANTSLSPSIACWAASGTIASGPTPSTGSPAPYSCALQILDNLQNLT